MSRDLYSSLSFAVPLHFFFVLFCFRFVRLVLPQRIHYGIYVFSSSSSLFLGLYNFFSFTLARFGREAIKDIYLLQRIDGTCLRWLFIHGRHTLSVYLAMSAVTALLAFVSLDVFYIKPWSRLSAEYLHKASSLQFSSKTIVLLRKVRYELWYDWYSNSSKTFDYDNSLNLVCATEQNIVYEVDGHSSSLFQSKVSK